MKEKIIQELSNKKVLILGFGREGRSTYNFIKENEINCDLAIADQNKVEVLEKNVKLYTGEKYLDSMKDYDVIIKTPGISLKDVNLTGIRDRITSQTELILKNGGDKIIGITGTKGKSTTSSLIYNMLKQKYNVLLVGNIGLPAFEMIDSYDEIDWYIYELSSHQLEFVDYSPKIAVLLNMYEEHLDHYRSYEAYKEAKRNIFKFQHETDWYVYNKDMEEVINNIPLIEKNVGVSSKHTIGHDSTWFEDKSVNIDIEGIGYNITLPQNMALKGKHNIYNIAVAATVAKILAVPDDQIVEGIATFKTLAHRLQCIGTYGDITFVDDSISTIPEATKYAIESFSNVDTVIIGGMDRGIHYADLVKYLSGDVVKNIILMYDSGKRIYEKLKGMDISSNVIYADDLEKAVQLAIQLTEKGKTCIMSPAAASYGYFKNFEERGEKFKEYIIKYAK